jgi:prevent-host-death family protein
MAKTSVSIAGLKARLSEHLRRVKNGNELVITDRGAPVARLVPLEPSERRATRRDRLVHAGVLRPGKGRVRRALQIAPEGPQHGEGVTRALLEERSDDSAPR